MAIIGISGKKRHGKDLVGMIIQWLVFQTTAEAKVIDFNNFQEWVDFHNQYEDKTSHYSVWKNIKFADKLKDIVCLVIGCTRAQLENDKFKNTTLGEEWIIYKVHNYDEFGYISSYEEALEIANEYDTEVSSIKMTPRFILQYIGTDLFRNHFNSNVWVNATMADYKKIFTDVELEDNQEFLDKLYPSWIITDIRFLNEVKAIKDRDGIVIRVERPSIKSNDKHISETALDSYKGFDYTIFNDGNIEDLIQTVREILIIEKII